MARMIRGVKGTDVGVARSRDKSFNIPIINITVFSPEGGVESALLTLTGVHKLIDVLRKLAVESYHGR